MMKNVFKKVIAPFPRASKAIGNSGLARVLSFVWEQCAQWLELNLGLRHRYLMTRQRNLRFRYVATVALFTISSFIILALSSPRSQAVHMAAVNFNDIAPAAGYVNERDIEQSAYIGTKRNFLIRSRTFPKIPDPMPLKREVTIQSGDALGVVMERQGVGNSITANIISAMKDHYDPRDIRAGQKIYLDFEDAKDGGQAIQEMRMPLDTIKTLVVARSGEEFKARVDEKDVKKRLKAKQATVKISLYGSAAQAGIPQGIVAEAIRIYSWNVDFQRDIRSDDSIEILYESYETEEGHVAKNGNILYANLTLGGKDIPLYRFKMSDGRIDYFQPDGISIKRTLMRTPINGARMSSGYGLRKHPVLGYNKMHKGVDFAAPKGTPIFAAGDGVVEYAGWKGAYGKYIRIRHNSKIKTAYAHMNKIRSHIKVGTRVKQGQVIATVGSTGRSTGPHLHYEVLVHGKQVNPRSVNLPTGEELRGKEKQRFQAEMQSIKKEYVAALDGAKVAQLRSKLGLF